MFAHLTCNFLEMHKSIALYELKNEMMMLEIIKDGTMVHYMKINENLL
jgi:hypothetical protein